ncbi:MAG: lysophospholipid acyltransferase family protein [Gammaproteobacteria bacterium]|jgi:1-acyl-sn-glycerol-3-phosphate acyltransferase
MLSFFLRTVWLLWNWLELFALTLFLYLLAWIPSFLTRSYYHFLFRVWCDFFVRALGVDLRIHEKNLGPIPEQFILIANHPSAFEDVGIPSVFDVYPLAKQGVRKWFFAGKINEAAGTLFVQRDDKDSRKKAILSMIERVKQGDNIALFPEGGCMGRRIHSSFKTGAFDVSIQTGVPILPVFLHYEAQETFEWKDPHTILHKFWHFMTSQNDQANYYVYDAIYPEGFSDKDEFAEHVRQKYLIWQSQYLE